MALEFMKTKHTIDDIDFTISKIQPTTGLEFTTRRVVVTTVADSVELEFTHEGFEMFKAIMREY